MTLLAMFVVVLAFTIITGAVTWGWRTGSLHTTEQERFDAEFERIVRRLETAG